jgi:prevent-host-death family protein
MKTILVSEFKAKCIAILKEVQRWEEPIVVTLRGQPMVRVVPFTDEAERKQLRALRGSTKIRRNLVRSDTTEDWAMLK